MNDERKQALIEKYRDINIEDDWWDQTYDDFTRQMANKHIVVNDIRFKGFWSQGDGASFTGLIRGNERFFKDHELTESYPWMTKFLGLGGEFTLVIERKGQLHHYAHENTIGVDLDFAGLFSHHIEQRDDLRTAIAERWDQHLESEYDTICATVDEIIRGYCRDLYKQLEETYNYLTSDEAVWGSIRLNDLDTKTNEKEDVQ